MSQSGVRNSLRGKARRVTPRPGRRPQFFRPHLEEFEDRVLLAVTWVNPAGGSWGDTGELEHGPVAWPQRRRPHPRARRHRRHPLRRRRRNETLVLSGGSLTIAVASELSGAFTLNGGTLKGAGDVTVTGPLSWTTGTMSGTGRTVVATGGTLTLSGSNGRFLSRVL